MLAAVHMWKPEENLTLSRLADPRFSRDFLLPISPCNHWDYRCMQPYLTLWGFRASELFSHLYNKCLLPEQSSQPSNIFSILLSLGSLQVSDQMWPQMYSLNWTSSTCYCGTSFSPGADTTMQAHSSQVDLRVGISAAETLLIAGCFVLNKMSAKSVLCII